MKLKKNARENKLLFNWTHNSKPNSYGDTNNPPVTTSPGVP